MTGVVALLGSPSSATGAPSGGVKEVPEAMACTTNLDNKVSIGTLGSTARGGQDKTLD